MDIIKVNKNNIAMAYKYDNYKYIIATKRSNADMRPWSCRYVAITGRDTLASALVYIARHRTDNLVIITLA